jgi:acyl carrier protein
LTDLVGEALGIEENSIDPDGNFIELGGDSLKAVKLISLIKEKFNVDLPPSAIFSKAKISNIASKYVTHN